MSSAEEIAALSLAPGDVVVMRDGTWRDQNVVFKAQGSKTRPIILRAETAGGVVLEGASSVTVDGGSLVLDGLHLNECSGIRNGIEVFGSDNRITSCAVTGGRHRNYLRLHGIRHRVDHCHFSGKTGDNPTVQIEVEEVPNYHRLDHNHFGERPPLGHNGGETIRVGYSFQSTRSSVTLVEHNLFERCDGEVEIISNKSCDNIYRANTFRECAGFLTLRHGNRCRVEGNFFFGNLKPGSGGIRVIGEDHVVSNNLIDSVMDGALRIGAGMPDSPLNGYFEARKCVIAFNTVTGSPGACIDLDAGYDEDKRPRRPDNIAFSHNVFMLPPGSQLTKGREGTRFHWVGNFSNLNDSHATKADLMLAKDAEGIWRPSPGSPLQGAVDYFAGINTDIDGQLRRGRYDAGCDQISQAPATSLPLTVADVGPVWMRPGLGSNRAGEILDHDRQRILAAAANALRLSPPSVTREIARLSEGGPNDFYSNGDYWWPDPEKPDGLPYIQRDGLSNPDNFNCHREAMRNLRDAVAALGAAWIATGDDEYPAKAAELLTVFFVDPATRMNPHLRYAQAIPGVTPGRGIGIIDTLHLVEIPKAIQAMENSPAFTPALTQSLKDWFRDYSRWMVESDNGKQEAAAKNNHSVAYFLQLAVFAAFTGDQALLADCRRCFKEVLVPLQMAPDGSFPLELARTKPYGYSIFQLDNLTTLCQVLSTGEDDMWSFKLADGRGIRRAVDFLDPYLADKSAWPHARDVQSWDGWPARPSCLLFAGLAYHEAPYLGLWKTLEPDPRDPEISRNIAITQPVLWLGDRGFVAN